MLLGFKPGIIPFKVIIPLGYSAIPPLLQRCQYLNNGEFYLTIEFEINVTDKFEFLIGLVLYKLSLVVKSDACYY